MAEQAPTDSEGLLGVSAREDENKPCTEAKSILALGTHDGASLALFHPTPTPLPFSIPQALAILPLDPALLAEMKSHTSKPGSPLPQTEPLAAEAGRPLNVTDALGYLDAVKIQFAERPEVYNQFLDIMKDFKSQNIDTPGVIDRVSKLFNGNPYLIQGFNTFLPVGYRIEVSGDPSDPNTITVTTPQGTTTKTTNGVVVSPRPPRDPQAIPPPGHGNPLLYPPSAPPPAPTANIPGGSASRSHTPAAYHISPHGQVPFDPSTIPPTYSASQSLQQSNQVAAAASFLGNLHGRQAPPPTNPSSAQVDKDGNGQFNLAIQYLNKIKMRYSDDPETYKQFLDILQAYKKDTTPALQAQVSLQVQHLFKDAPELLAEFRVFLGEVGGPTNGIVILPQPSGSAASPWIPSDNISSSPAVAPGKKTQSVRRKKRGMDREPTPVPPGKPLPLRAKKAKLHHTTDPGSPSYSPYLAPQSPQPSSAPIYHTTAQSHPMSMHPSLPPSTQVRSPSGTTSADKLLFFDRAKKSLENREVYEEFLKLLSLFSREIIDLRTLVERTKVFLGDGDLMTEFKGLVGWDDKVENVEGGPPGSIRTGPPEALLALPVDDGEGPSYRKLPDSEIRLACSGRDQLCRSVLNDEWVSHPTWASEEAGFMTHKKNSFEEALHKSEEERHEYHVVIEGLAKTIAVLEPINDRIEEMSNEERANFKLKPDLGGTCRAIYQRTIKRIYGKENIGEIWQNLQECPAVAVPVVFNRLKAKDEEWRRLQREFSRTWREVDSKNFYKSLDHQGITFKQNDKKNITAKYFVTDIESIKGQQLATWEREGKKAFSHGSVGHQLEYSFNDMNVMIDALKMICSFLDHSQAHYSPQERRSVEKFLRTFIPLLCMYPASEFNAAWGPFDGGNEEDVMHDAERSGRRSVGSTHSNSMQTSGVPANDLRRKLLKMAREKEIEREREKGNRKVSGSNIGSRAATPMSERSPAPPRVGFESGVYDIWIKEAKATVEGVNNSAMAERPFFTNTTFYTLVRLLQVLYSRLSMCKEIGQELAEEKHASLLANRVAVELGLDDPNGPAVVLSQTMEILGERGTAENANVVYLYLIHACDKLFDNDLDQATFEEHMRWFFGNKAYLLFTLDKLMMALIKQVQTIWSDSKCRELWSLLQAAQASEMVSRQDIVRYRREAEQHVGQDENLYKLQWVREKKSMQISLLGPEDPSTENRSSRTERWRDYVNTFVMKTPTEWVPATRAGGSPVFLRRNGRAGEGKQEANRESTMKIRVDVRTYKVVYEAGGEEVVWRGVEKEEEVLWEAARVREEERRKSSWWPCELVTGHPLAWHLRLPPCSLAHGQANPKASRSPTIPPPSAALLSFLGPLLAVSSRAAASPAPPPPPPPFLCPSIYTVPAPSPTIHPRSAPARPHSLHRRSPVSGGARALPLHFEPGDDGVWRRVQTYTLYGSVICSQPCQTPTGTLGSDQLSDLDAANLTGTIKLHDTLPAGWQPSPDTNENRTALIFALSLVLAILISLFIVGCLFWRKSRRRRRKRKDIEMRTHRKSRTDHPSHSRVDVRKEAKEIQKIWARATARWRQNALYAARKRRGRRPVSPRSHLRASSTHLHISPSFESPAADGRSLSQRTLPATPDISRRPSIESNASLPLSASPPEETPNTPHISLSIDPSTSSPPAYRQRTRVNPSAHQSDLLAPDDHSSPDSMTLSVPHLSHVSPSASPSGGKSPASHGSQTPRLPIQAAHVATDDKMLLARLADLAERPPGEIACSARSSHQVSAPVWEDEDLEDFARIPEASGTDASNSTSQLPYPPPPTKGKMAESSFYAYRGSFEEFSDSIDPETGPSAPPFDFEALGRPALGDIVMLPSAPPLQEDSYPLEAPCTISPDTSQNRERSQERPSTTVSRPLSDGNLPGYQP